MKRLSRSALLRAAAALAAGLVEPSIEVAWKCRAAHAASEACVWGRAYLPVGRGVGLVVIAPLAFAVLTLAGRAWRARSR